MKETRIKQKYTRLLVLKNFFPAGTVVEIELSVKSPEEIEVIVFNTKDEFVSLAEK
jgi:hypothetical protein